MEINNFVYQTIPSLLINDISINDINDIVHALSNLFVKQVTFDQSDFEIQIIENTTKTLLLSIESSNNRR